MKPRAVHPRHGRSFVCVATPNTLTEPARPSALVSSHEDIVQGTRLDHFRIERRLGAGGMGEVYLATDLVLNRPVAVKLARAMMPRCAASHSRSACAGADSSSQR